MVCTTLLLEGTGFELPVPRAMQGRPKAIIDGFGCMPPSLDYLRLPLVEISEGGPKRNLGTEALSREEPEVRIPVPFKRPLTGRRCRLVRPGRPAGSCPRIPCFEHPKGTCTPTGRPRRKSRGRLRFERQYRD